MKYLFILLLTELLFSSCVDNTNRGKIVYDKMQSFTQEKKGTLYFPFDTLKGNRNVLENWANNVLYDLKEPLLFNYHGNGEFVRFIWLRSFENPVIIRINRFNDSVYANIKELKIKANDTILPNIVKDTIVTVSKREWQNITEPIEKSNFFTAKYADNNLNEDGAIWFLEYRNERGYKVIRRWDNGRLSSEPLNYYLIPLINFANEYVSLKSLR